MKKLIPVLALVLGQVALSAQMAPVLAKGIKELAVSPNAVTDPVLPLYRISGVYEDLRPAGNPGEVSTGFFCSSSSAVQEKLLIYIYNEDGTLVAAKTYILEPGQSGIFTTKRVGIFQNEIVIPLGVPVLGGKARISGTSTNMNCGAAQIPGNTASYVAGVGLHVVRFNPYPGSQE